MKNKTRLILASASPRRLDLLAQIGIVPDDVIAAAIDETHLKNEKPDVLALRLARAKTEHVLAQHPDALVIGADTVVACGRQILPKAENETDVRTCLEKLSGRRHRVLGGICMCLPGQKPRTRLVTSIVRFKTLTRAEIQAYVASGEGVGKAGGYALQGRAAGFVAHISGSYSNIVGLSLYDTLQMLNGVAALGYSD